MEETESNLNGVSILSDSGGPHGLATGAWDGHNPFSSAFLKLEIECSAAIHRV